ncbi:hypothetical protein JJB11_18030 [Ramlibacter ginsenosidimutans]|uniref:Uncharacterized protein n=1 Tax=Ramlibacter ginsenosidimutans TaxID=502333 RepID=A0A934TV97_9BURK|nr:hypothetical protein [Ramlibacter ginsenosidimutans]MBK6008003.1 hypothetical protein [Ramlibacter ginsenosidimutans]
MLTLTLRGLFGAWRKEPSPGPFRATLPFVGGTTPQPDLIFRMKSWPQLPEHGRTAEVYRILSVMSSQPVNRRWLLARCRMAPHELDSLLMQLVADGALEVIDPAQFAGRQAHA